MKITKENAKPPHMLAPASYFCQAQPKPQLANPQLGAEIALFSQLWGTTIHHTPYTQPGIVVLPVSSLIIPTVGTRS